MVSWSSGKDSAWALHTLRQRPERYEVRGIFTTVTETFDRISIHSTPRWVLKLQSERLGLPLYEIAIPSPCTNAQYEAAMQAFLDRVQALPEHQTASHLAFGDLFLEDIRRYREDRLSGTGFTVPGLGNSTGGDDDCFRRARHHHRRRFPAAERQPPVSPTCDGTTPWLPHLRHLFPHPSRPNQGRSSNEKSLLSATTMVSTHKAPLRPMSPTPTSLPCRSDSRRVIRHSLRFCRKVFDVTVCSRILPKRIGNPSKSSVSVFGRRDPSTK